MTKTRDLADLGGGFIQAGTGAQQRTVESKLQDMVSVKDFGAVGDGVTDDTAAIQAAANYISQTGKSVFIPIGTYITDPITISIQAYALQGSFFGSNRERTIIKRKTAGAGAFITFGQSDSDIFQTNAGFSNLKIDGGVNTNGPAFAGYNIVRSTYNDVIFSGGSHACRLYGGISVTFNNCLFEAAQYGLYCDNFTPPSGTSGFPNIIRVLSGEIVDNSVYGVYFDNGSSLILDGIDVEGNGTTLGAAEGGVYIGPNIGSETFVNDTSQIGALIHNCWFESNRGIADIHFNSGINVITSSRFYSTSTESTNDLLVDGGRYQLRTCNFSRTGKTNILENAGAITGNLLECVEAPVLSVSEQKTAIFNGDFLQLRNGRVPGINGSTAPLILTGTDSTSDNPTIIFNQAFKPGTVPIVVCSAVDNNGTVVDGPQVYGITNSEFTVRKNMYNGTTVTTANYTISWIAIGENP
jgi:hypothetical protein